MREASPTEPAEQSRAGIQTEAQRRTHGTEDNKQRQCLTEQRVVGIGHATGASGAEDISSAAESVQRRAKFSNLEIKGDKMVFKRSIIKMTNDS